MPEFAPAQISPRLHFWAFLLALAALPLALVISFPLFRIIERPFLRNLLAEPFPEKNQGMLLQREAFVRGDVMSIYGSSELTTEVGNRANDFFRLKPTGFQVCPVGAAGNHTLLMAEKIAAQGDVVRGQQVVIILSPSWFYGKAMHRDHVAGNFSPLQTISLLQNPAINETLRRRFVDRILDYPTSLQRSPMLARHLRNSTETGWKPDLENALLVPVLWMWATLLSWEDHWNMLVTAFELGVVDTKNWEQAPKKIRWNEKLNQLTNAQGETGDEMASLTLLENGSNDAEFLAKMGASKEWGDFALLLDTLKLLEAKALIVSVPLAGRSFDAHGISRAARYAYYSRIESMSADRGFPAATFSEHDLDSNFLIGASSHLEAKGWLNVNRLLNDFHHGRIRTAARRGSVTLPAK